ncbi:MAG: alpha/beta fold hydrolase [Acidobacteria bacterium]|nr:alpha/beta fold hydrolase [Acidobacteriota bacterium]MBV9478275.1 alpha/beta fold hydrolase [Acidobacteriota bacterium]
MNPKPLRHVDLYSSAGKLEALYRELQDPAGVAVVCHPHPLGGGTLHNKVVFRAARGLEAANVATLRFNFRGVGASGGRHDEGEGEQEDVTAAIEWVKRKHPGKKLFVGGFSFGSWVASRVACERTDVDAMFLIGTPVNKYDFGYLRHCERPILFVHGTQDEHGDVAKLEKLIPHVRNAESVIITGADHFFTKQLEGLEETIRAWAEEIIEG